MKRLLLLVLLVCTGEANAQSMIGFSGSMQFKDGRKIPALSLEGGYSWGQRYGVLLDIGTKFGEHLHYFNDETPGLSRAEFFSTVSGFYCYKGLGLSLGLSPTRSKSLTYLAWEVCARLVSAGDAGSNMFRIGYHSRRQFVLGFVYISP